jgi:hypothetical protein
MLSASSLYEQISLKRVPCRKLKQIHQIFIQPRQ